MEVLFASSLCGGCKPALALVKQPKYVPHVRIVYVNESTEAYDEMKAAGALTTPTLVTKTGKKIGGAKSMAVYLEEAYG